MIQLPNPEEYDDPIRYFRDSHKIVAKVLDAYEHLIEEARKSGVNMLLADLSKWNEYLTFFKITAPIHEREEEAALFPVILEKVSHIGFQTPTTPSRFIHEQHTILKSQTSALLGMLKGYVSTKPLSEEEERRFIELSTELIKLFREHLGLENAMIYSAANDELLSPAERIGIMIAIQGHHGDQTIMPVINFSKTPYSSAEANESSTATDIVSSDKVIPIEWDDGEEEDRAK